MSRSYSPSLFHVQLAYIENFFGIACSSIFLGDNLSIHVYQLTGSHSIAGWLHAIAAFVQVGLYDRRLFTYLRFFVTVTAHKAAYFL